MRDNRQTDMRDHFALAIAQPSCLSQKTSDIKLIKSRSCMEKFTTGFSRKGETQVWLCEGQKEDVAAGKN